MGLEPSQVNTKETVPSGHRKRDRGSPESFKKTFLKPKPKASCTDSFMTALEFIPWGGAVEVNGRDIKLTNTCNFDGVMMVLQALWKVSGVGRAYLEDLRFRRDSVVEEVIVCIQKIEERDFKGAKTIWLETLLEIQFRNRSRKNMQGLTLLIRILKHFIILTLVYTVYKLVVT
jgi:hypothetical protein